MTRHRAALEGRHIATIIMTLPPRAVIRWQLETIMPRSLLVVLALLSCGALSGSVDAKARLTDAQVKQRVIDASIDSYPGNCPCPYNSARNGSRCGRRSAYHRAGGYAPLCYATDVSTADVKAWRASH